jgi:hypothetical protein
LSSNRTLKCAWQRSLSEQNRDDQSSLIIGETPTELEDPVRDQNDDPGIAELEADESGLSLHFVQMGPFELVPAPDLPAAAKDGAALRIPPDDDTPKSQPDHTAQR